MLNGERVEDLAGEFELPAGTRFRWKRRALIDAGGRKNYEPDELERARRRIKDLEAELELVKAASALFDGNEPPHPKGLARWFGG